MIIQNQSNVTYNYTLPDYSHGTNVLESNIVNTEILTNAVTLVKTSDKLYLMPGQTAHQKVVMTNNSLTPLQNLLFKDTLSSGASYVAGSVAVNGILQAAFNPSAGFALSNLVPGAKVTIDYMILADSALTEAVITNKAAVTYSVLDVILGLLSFSVSSNLVTITTATAQLSVAKTVDKAFANKGDMLHYTIAVSNTGNIDITGVIFQDPISPNATFVAGSVKIDGTPSPIDNPQQPGLALKNLAVGESTTVQFDVTVN